MIAVSRSGSDRQPLVTVLVGCYNHARFVEECLDAVLAQTYRNWELIIFDDLSSDNSVDLIERWIHRNNVACTFLAHRKNIGVCRSLNEVIRLSSGKYISMTSADDVWLPDKLETQVAMLEELPERVGVVYSEAFQIDEHGQVLPELFIEAHRSFAALPEGMINNVLWQGNFIPAMTTLIRRRCYDEVGLYDEGLPVEDWDMWLRISEKFEFRASPKISAKYRILATSLTRSRPDKLLDSFGLMSAKFLALGRLTGASRIAAVDMLCSYAQTLYRRGDPEAASYMRLAMRYRKSLRLAFTYALNCVGVPASVALRPYDVLRTLRPKRVG